MLPGFRCQDDPRNDSKAYRAVVVASHLLRSGGQWRRAVMELADSIAKASVGLAGRRSAVGSRVVPPGGAGALRPLSEVRLGRPP